MKMGSRIRVTDPREMSRLKTLCTCESKRGQGSTYAIGENDKIMTIPCKKNVSHVYVPLGNQEIIVPYAKAREFVGYEQEQLEPIEFPLLQQQLRDYQAVDMECVLEKINRTGCVCFTAQPAYGKTLMFIDLIYRLKQATIIVLPTVPLVEQTEKVIRAKIGNNPEEQARVHILGLDGRIPDTCDILIAFVERIIRLDREGPLSEFTLCIFDEYHLLSARTHLACLMTLNPLMIAAFTATPGDRKHIQALFTGEEIIHGSYSKAWSICFPKLITGIDTSQIAKNAFQEHSAEVAPLVYYTNTISELSYSESLQNAILRVINHYISQGERMIIITMRVEMVQMIYNACVEDSQNRTRYIPEYIDSSKPEAHNCDILIGTYQKMGTGFDEKNSIIDFNREPARYMMFLGSFKHKDIVFQVAGRSIRAKQPVSIFPCLDIGFSHRHVEEIKNHARNEYKDCHIDEEEERLIEELMKEPHLSNGSETSSSESESSETSD
jgi:hypothetical protein